MPTNKNALLRYQILDRCFSDFTHRFFIDDLLHKVNGALSDLCGTAISVRQIREDIRYMKDRMAYNAPIVAVPYEGKKCYYRYSDPGFSIFNTDLSNEETQKLRSTIEMLGRFRGIPGNGWLEEVISHLEIRFGVKPNKEHLVSFGQNENLKGLEFLSELIDCAIRHQPIRVLYRSFYHVEYNTVVHPYHLKQYNNRWFLLGLEETEKGTRFTNKALDRIVKFSCVDVPFIENKEYDFNAYYKDVVGVTVPKDHPQPEDVELKFDEARFPYILSKPIHPSQEVIDEEHHIVRLHVRPNKELESQIFFFGPQVEVLKPAWLRQQIADKIAESYKKYFPCAE